MKVYFIVFFLALMMSVVLPAKTDKQWRWKLFFTFLPLFLFAAIRVDFGNDYSAYEFLFDEIHGISKFMYNEKLHGEIGYQYLCYIMPSYRSILILNAFILCFALAVFIYINIPKKYLWLAILLIFLNAEKNIYGNLVGIRNGLVVTGFILGIGLIQNRKIILFGLLTALLSTFHTSALLFMPLAYLVGRTTKITRTEVLIWIGVVVVLLVFSVSGLMNLIAPFISQYFDRYEYYLEDMEAHRGILLTGASLVLIVLIFILYDKEKNILTGKQNSLIRLGLLYVVSAFLGSLAVRANYFYDMFFIGTVVVLLANSNRDTIWLKNNRGSRIVVLLSNSSRDITSIALATLSVLMSFYSLILWMTCKWVAGNPLYYVYTSIIGSW